MTKSGQKDCISGIRSGKTFDDNWGVKGRPIDSIDIKEDMYMMLSAAGISINSLNIDSQVPSYYNSYQSGCVKLGKDVIGYFGSIHPRVLKSMSIKENVFAFEVFVNAFDNLKVKSKSRPDFSPSQYQSVTRDFSFEFDLDVKASDIIKNVKSVDRKLITDVLIFDQYIDKNNNDKKSIGIRVKIQPLNSTFTDEDIVKICDKIIDVISAKNNGVQK